MWGRYVDERWAGRAFLFLSGVALAVCYVLYVTRTGRPLDRTDPPPVAHPTHRK